MSKKPKMPKIKGNKDSKREASAPLKAALADKPVKLLAPSEAQYLKSREDSADKEDTLDIVSFYLNESLFALEVEFIKAVIRFRKIVELPHMPDFIDGLISVRGEMILVMNLKERLGLDRSRVKSENIIVTEQPSIANETGILVDRMAGVMEVDSKFKVNSKRAKAKKGAAKNNEQAFDFIKGTVESSSKESIKVLDIQKLMAFDMPSEIG